MLEMLPGAFLGGIIDAARDRQTTIYDTTADIEPTAGSSSRGASCQQ